MIKIAKNMKKNAKKVKQPKRFIKIEFSEDGTNHLTFEGKITIADLITAFERHKFNVLYRATEGFK